MSGFLEMDGSMGEGGGQILRSALTLSALTGRPFRMTRIRANRDRPGLMPQHLAAVRAAARVCGAETHGDRKGSGDLEFIPGAIRAGHHDVDIGTAGSVTLLLHAVCYPLVQASGASELVLLGGTHVPHSPAFHDLANAWAPWLDRLGLPVTLVLRRAGFYPAGGGEVSATVPGGAVARPLTALDRGGLREVIVQSGVGNLPLAIAERQRERALERLRRDRDRLQGARIESEIVPMRSPSPGTFVTVTARFSSGPATFSALGARGKRAERVADEAVDALFAFLATRGVVDRHLADQLALPLALAPGTSEVRVACVTRHLETNLEVIRRFLEVSCSVDAPEGSEGVMTIRG